MQVHFGNNPAVKVPPFKPVDVETRPVTTPKHGFWGTTRELWKDTLKVKADAESYTAGFFRGIKNSLLAGAALVGIDWLVTSGINIGKALGKGEGLKETAKVLKAPLSTLGTGICKGAKFVAEMFSNSPTNTLAEIAKAPFKLLAKVTKAKGTLSPVARYGVWAIIPAVIGYTTFRSYLNANEQKARVDHRYGGDVGHK